MACACKGRKSTKYVWTSDDGSSSVTYPSEIQAKAKVLRVGGSYKPQG
jgi:hypothetical protein